MDIYNYAARFDCIPSFKAQAVRGQLGKSRKTIQVTIELSEQSIRVVGRGENLISAEHMAIEEFKKQAEKYHAERGEGPIIIKDSTALTTAKIKDFFKFYHMTYPHASVKVQVDTYLDKEISRNQRQRAQVRIDDVGVGEPVEMPTKARAEQLAFLTAAVALKKKNPTLYSSFIAALRAGNGTILPPIHPIHMSVNEDCMRVMHDTLQIVRNAGLPNETDQLDNDDETVLERTFLPRNLRPLGLGEADLRNVQLQEDWSAYMQDPRLEKLRKARDELPMSQHRRNVLELVNNNQYSIIVGATGSGKTTQVPQIIFEEAIARGEGSTCNIICTQPRRIATTSVAQRVVYERNERLQESVGYVIRLDSKIPLHPGSITFSTTGSLTKQLQFQADTILDRVSHIIVDEVHERDIAQDFLLIMLKRTIERRTAMGRPCPKVVLMSATLNTELFASYFDTRTPAGDTKDCPTLTVPGRNFPVREIYLDSILSEMQNSYPRSVLSRLLLDPPTRDYLEANDRFCREQGATGLAKPGSNALQVGESIIDWKQERTVSADGAVSVIDKDNAVLPMFLIGLTIAHIVKTTDEGAVLVFLPGIAELDKVEQLLRERPLDINFSNSSEFLIYKLHSSLSTGQTEVFNAVSQGCRKIILATNIAETSITIPDVRHVVDTGKMRENVYDSLRRITQLQYSWISKSNSKQRAGRAGRVQNGNYYALFPKIRFDWMRPVPTSELLRTDLQKTCLEIRNQAIKYPIREFLAEAVEPPSPRAVDAAVLQLQALGALTADENSTPLGRLLSLLPTQPALGKVIVLGVIFRCLDPILTLGAALEDTLFMSPAGQRDPANRAKLDFAQETKSDHVATINAVLALRYDLVKYGEGGARAYAMNNFISFNAFRRINNTAIQVEQVLVQAGLIPFTPASARRDCQLGDPTLNTNSSNIQLIKALAVAAFYPNLARSSGGRMLRTPSEPGAMLHPSSINVPRNEDGKEAKEFLRPGILYTFGSLTRSSDGNNLFLRDTTECTPLTAALFGGKISVNRSILQMDGWLPLYLRNSNRRNIETIVEFRNAIDSLMAGVFRDLAVQQQRPSRSDWSDPPRTFLADDVVRSAFAEGLVSVLDHDAHGELGGPARLRNQWMDPTPIGSANGRDWARPAKYSTAEAESKKRAEAKQNLDYYEDLLWVEHIRKM